MTMPGSQSFVFELDEKLSDGGHVAMVVTMPSGRRLQLWAEVELVGRRAIPRQFAI